jgi:hypothetical protein
MIFEALFGHAIVDDKDFVARSVKWKNAWTEPGEAPLDAFRFALIRDPTNRLLSAWRSKIACDDSNLEIDKGHRGKLVSELLGQAGSSNLSTSCLTLEQFVDALYDAHQKVSPFDLNTHFRPQTANCMVAERSYNLVCDVEDSPCVEKLPGHLRYQAPFPHRHESISRTGRATADAGGSTAEKVEGPPEEVDLVLDKTEKSEVVDYDTQSLLAKLDPVRRKKVREITADDYAGLKNYLKDPLT